MIWCEDPAGADAESEAFPSSHRLICTATHNRPGMYGAPTGRRVRYRVIADCAISHDRVNDEWLVHDQGAIVRQLGFDVVDWTRELIAREGGPEHCVKPMPGERRRRTYMAEATRTRGSASPISSSASWPPTWR